MKIQDFIWRGLNMFRQHWVVGACIASLAFVGQVQAAPILTFLIDGNTFTQPFSIDNNSPGGELVTRFQLDLAGTGNVFDTVTGPPPNGTFGVPFTPVGSTDVATGLVGPVTVPDGSTLLDISFTDFEPSETFSWDIDVDMGTDATVLGDDLIGALAIVDFSNGQRLLGSLESVPGNPDASSFTVSGVTTTPGVPVPEPTSLALWGMVALGAAICVGRRRGSSV